jgi:hypothetical protein
MTDNDIYSVLIFGGGTVRIKCVVFAEHISPVASAVWPSLDQLLAVVALFVYTSANVSRYIRLKHFHQSEVICTSCDG